MLLGDVVRPGTVEREGHDHYSVLRTVEENFGVVHLVWPHGPKLVDGGFSIAGVMTAKLPVSYSASDAVTRRNGYGTLAEAGWSEPFAIAGAHHEPGGVVALFTPVRAG